jgi:hypothetical protein
MGRVVRTLMKVPAVRRVMVRLANLEAAIAKQQMLLDALDQHRARLSADQASQQAALQEMAASLSQAATHDQVAELSKAIQILQTQIDTRLATRDQLHRQQAQMAALGGAVQIQKSQIDALSAQQAQTATLSSAVQTQQTQIDALLAHRAQAASLGSAVQTQQTQIDALLAHQALTASLNEAVRSQQTQIEALVAQVRRLAADGDKYSAVLAEVSQHLPPAQRANLEATLHGQQLQLGALNSTVHAQQMQLAALNDIVRRSSSDPPGKPAATDTEAGSRKDPPPRPAVSPYTFEQLLNREVESLRLDLVFNIHVPKAAGNTVNTLFRQLGFFPLSLDMTTNDFFRLVREERWFEGYAAPPPRDAYLMTGHMRLDQPIFRRLWMPHVIVSVLREPVERMLSNYNFTLRRPANPWHDEVVNKGMSFVEYASRMLKTIGPQYSFFDDTGQGIFARTGKASVQECLTNLKTKVSFYGLSERFDEFAALSGYLLGRAQILAITPANVTRDIEDRGGVPLKTALTAQERDGLDTMLKDDIWFYRQAVKEYEERVSDRRLQAILSHVLPLVRSSSETMAGVLALKDPADPNRRAFQRIE